MNFTIIVSPIAEKDIKASFDYYEVQRYGLGEEFLFCIEECLFRIKRTPQHYLNLNKSTRRAIVRRFPYLIYYSLKENEIHIIAVLHQRNTYVIVKRRLK